MRKRTPQRGMIGIVFILVFSIFSNAQTGVTWNYRTGAVTIATQDMILNSPNPKLAEDHHITESMLYKIKFKDITRLLGKKHSGGIKATLNNSSSYVDLLVYIYDPSKSNGKGPIIYGTLLGKHYKDIADTKWPWDPMFNRVDVSPDGIIEKPIDLKDYPGYSSPANSVSLLFWFSDEWSNNIDGHFTAFIDDAHHIDGSIIPGLERLTPESYFNVVIELKVRDATVELLRVPGLGTFAPFDVFFKPDKKITDIQHVYLNPSLYPDYLFVMAHRGYFRDVPENSQEAMRLAVAMQIPAVELDVQLTKDNVWVMSHDANIGWTKRTTVPERLSQRVADWERDHGGHGMPIKELTLCDIRPDLCSKGAGHYNWTQRDQYEPVWMSQPEGAGKVPMATLEELLLLCKNKVLVNIDKVDKGNTPDEARFDLIWNLVAKTGMHNMVIVKGTNWPTPQSLKSAFPHVDWNQLWYTPTYFFDKLPNDLPGNKLMIDTWCSTTDNFNCPGFELIYMRTGDKAYNLIDHIRSKQKHIIQFPMWMEFCEHVTVDARTDYRNSWNWLLDHNTSKRPTMIITDRLEVLVDLLKRNGLQNTGIPGW